MTPKISVIVPVYNVEKYLSRCIDSILAQTFTDFELLLIDDGSPDSSGKICDEYAKKDGRIRVFHKPNGGVSSARNLGLDYARGEWIAFVDSDDWIHEDCFSVFGIKEIDRVDMIEIPSKRVGTNKINIPSVSPFIMGEKDVVFYLSNNFKNEAYYKYLKNTTIDKLRFNESMKIGEDALFLLEVLSRVKQIYFSHFGFYCYEINPSGAMSSTSIEQIVHQHELLFNKIKDMNIQDNDITRGFLIREIGWLNTQLTPKQLSAMLRWLGFSWYWAVWFSSNISMKNKIKILVIRIRSLLSF